MVLRRTSILLGAIIFAILPIAAAQKSALHTLDPRDGTVLMGSAALLALDQCSHYGPTEASGTWLPLPSQIAELESRLPSFIKRQDRRPPGALATYYRQYVGVVLRGHEFMYVNGFPKDSVASSVEAFERFHREHPEVILTSHEFPDSMRTLDGWRHSAVVACDGGSAYWGVLYDPATRRFSAFSSNGIG